MKVKPYADVGRFTSVHNSLIDNLMRIINGNTFKILLFMIRQTHGWEREEAGIGYADILRGTGIKHPMTVRRALIELIESGHVISSRSDDKWEASTYRLNSNLEVEWTPYDIEYRKSSATSKNEVKAIYPASIIDVEPAYATSINEVDTTSRLEVAIRSKNEANIRKNYRGKKEAHASRHANDNSPIPKNSFRSENQDGWNVIFGAVMEACGITDNQIQASGKLQKDVADVVKWALKECSDKEPLQIAKRIKAFGIWWCHKENKGQRYGLPTPSVIIRFWGHFVKWCKDNLDGYLPTEETFEFPGIKA
ncbi:MAG: hypothetical protein ACLGJB_24840 [Blastocatellia bacterium]